MQFQFSFLHMDSSEALKTYAEEKILEKVQKFVSKPIEAVVTFSVVRHTHHMHLSLKAGDGFGIDVENESADMYATVDGAIAKLAVQLKKHKEKLKDHKLPKPSQIGAAVEVPEDAVDAADIVKYESARRRSVGR